MAIFYVLVFLLLLQVIIIPQDNQRGIKVYLLLAFLELQVVSGLRLPSAGDSEYYTDLFVEVSQLSLDETLNYGLEKGFMLFLYLVSLINKSPQAILFFSSLLLNSLVLGYIYKESRKPWLSVVLYVTFLYFFSAMNLMRFMIACIILLYSNEYIVKRDPIRFFIILLVAASFHFSSLMYGIAYFLYPIKLNCRNLAMIATPFIVLSFFILPVFQFLIQINGRYSSYENAGEFDQSAYANILEFLFSLCVFLFFAYQQKWSLKDISGLNKLYMWLAFVATIFFFMSINVMMIIRFASMFSLVFIVYIANVISEMDDLMQRRWIISFFSVSFLKMLVVLTFRPEWYFGSPYENLLF